MLFANEELEPSVPVFPEPVKVQPEVEDEMSRRIKSTLGEYLQVKDLLIKDPKNLIGISMNNAVATSVGKNSAMSDVKTLIDNQSELCVTVANTSDVQQEAQSSEQHDCDSEKSTHNEIEHDLCGFEKDLQKDVLVQNNNESANGQNDVHSSGSGAEFESREASDLQSNNRRPSLKRQCKDKISIYDFEPFYNVWTKKTKVCNRSRYPRNQGKGHSMSESSAECDDQKHCDDDNDFFRSEEIMKTGS